MALALQPHNQAPNGAYVFSSRPRPAPTRLKYKDPAVIQNEGSYVYGNIMYVRRVVRGNTYAQHTLPLRSQPDPAELQKQAKEQFCLLTPEALEGRKHTEVQTELYLEELSDHPEDASVGCQTDAFLDKPATPLFIPAKSGKDVATQIEEGELFHFDTEVQPVLEVLIGKTMEQALLEVLEEEELASLRAQQEQERRHREEKVTLPSICSAILADLLPSVYNTLKDQGYFYDPVQRDIETGFLPWLMDEEVLLLDIADVQSTLRRVNTRKSPGPDNIPGRVLRECADQLTYVLTDIFNTSLDLAKVPSCFKSTVIIPVPKKAHISSLNDYRPVALTPIMRKCFERLVKWHITSGLPTTFDPFQFAYRPNRSTEDAISSAFT
uniref:Radial spoke head 3 n=1 Tax=Astyanax mexicanus TaxID=7994 RepID=A0A3B1JFF3_ASTMX